jgi:hypothetical protein
MTAAQKTAKAKFKQAIAYRQKTGVSLKEAFAHIYGKKVKAAVKKRLGALPIGFKGSIFNIPFKIVNQYDIYNDVSALMEDTDTGNRIVAFDGKGSAKDKAEAIVSYINKATQGKYADNKELNSRMLKFATNMQKEVKDFNAGKKKTIKKEPLKILAPKNIVTTKKRLPSVIKLINKTIDKVYKKSKIKKKVAKKVVRKVVKKKAAPKKVAKKKLTNRDYDKRYQALRPGKRVAYETGNVYYENRANRSDRGKLLGFNDITLTRINNDLNGNPRYVVHFLNVLNSEEQSFLPFNKKYEYALKKAKLIGGKKYDNKQYGGGIVFGSIFNSEALKQKINNLMQTTPKIKY